MAREVVVVTWDQVGYYEVQADKVGHSPTLALGMSVYFQSHSIASLGDDAIKKLCK